MKSDFIGFAHELPKLYRSTQRTARLRHPALKAIAFAALPLLAFASCWPSTAWFYESETSFDWMIVSTAVLFFTPVAMLGMGTLSRWIFLLTLVLTLWMEQSNGVTITNQLNHEGSDIFFFLLRVVLDVASCVVLITRVMVELMKTFPKEPL